MQNKFDYPIENCGMYKENKNDKIYWIDNSMYVTGEMLFTFDKKKIYNFFEDFPQNLTDEEVEIFKKENPTLAKLKL